MYFDLLERSGTLKSFRATMMSINPILEEIADLSNAFKHCVRNGKPERKRGSRDLILLKIDANLLEEGTKIELNMSVEGIAQTQEIVGQAWRSWMHYNQKPS